MYFSVDPNSDSSKRTFLGILGPLGWQSNRRRQDVTPWAGRPRYSLDEVGNDCINNGEILHTTCSPDDRACAQAAACRL